MHRVLKYISTANNAVLVYYIWYISISLYPQNRSGTVNDTCFYLFYFDFPSQHFAVILIF